MASDEFDATRRDAPADVTRLDPDGPRRPLDAPGHAYGRAVPSPPGPARPGVKRDKAIPGMWDPASVARRRRRSRLLSWTGIAVSLAVIGGVLVWTQARERKALEVTGLEVTAPEGVLACDGATRSRTVRLAATLTLNGGSGEIRYRWRQSDSGPGPASAAEVPAGQESLVVPLSWQVSGPGRTSLTGTFELLAPSVREASASFEYSCR